jgi:glycosyltransferase involved in cell wall biosynthesis
VNTEYYCRVVSQQFKADSWSDFWLGGILYSARVPLAENVMVTLAGEGVVPVPKGVNVHFVRNLVNRREHARVFAAPDVFVSSSLMETYRVTLIEAMACGTPVVAFRVSGIPEAALDGQDAIVCDRKDCAALLEAVTTVRDSKQLRESLGNAGHEMLHTRNGLRSFAQAFMRLYEEYIPPARTPFDGRSALAA